MADVKVCRICLNINVKMHDLHSFPLESYFASIMIESKPLYSDTLPRYACYECAAFVKKIYLFRQKCVRSQALLCGLIDECGKLTTTVINSINRQSLLAQSKLIHIDIKDEEFTTKNLNEAESSVIIYQECGIKKEDEGNYNSNKLLNDFSTDDNDDNDKSDDDMSSEKIVENVQLEKVDIQVKLDVDEEECFESTEVSDSITILPPEVPPVKLKKQTRTTRKGLRNKKKITRTVKRDDDVCSDDKTDLEDIDVITLSIEEQLEEIEKRKQSSNYLNCPYKCHLCYKGFNNTHTWKHHVAKHSPNAGDVECKICKYRFKTQRKLQRHALNHGRRYVCKMCPYYSSNVTTVKEHQGSHKGVTHKCNYCDEVFTVKTTYVSHMRIKHPSENICCYCGYSFYSKQGLLVHKNMVHKDVAVKAEEDKDGPYCEECDVKFISIEAYKRHVVMSVKHTRSTDSINGCRVCGATFSDPEELRLHHRKEHPKRRPVHYRLKTSKWPAKCEHCPEVLQTGRAYLKHFRTAHPDQNYPLQKKCVCDICGKRFTCNALVEMHKRTHFGDRPYKCSQCDKACFTAFDLRAHQQKHSDTRPFPCTVCPKAFKRKEALERHLKIHSGDNLYKCEICGVAFNKSSTRTLHVRTVHTKEPAPPRKRRNKNSK